MTRTPIVAGFTGTRHGMTAEQRHVVRRFLREWNVTQWHHGDCIGADAESHAMALVCDIDVVLHPPTDNRLRAYCRGAFEVLDELPYIQRNRRIVDSVSIMLATPHEAIEQQRGGTWSTIRYAKRTGRELWIVLPDGKLEQHNTPGART